MSDDITIPNNLENPTWLDDNQDIIVATRFGVTVYIPALTGNGDYDALIAAGVPIAAAT